MAALLAGVIFSLGCGDPASKTPTQNAQPVGEQAGKNKKHTMPAPPPIEKVN